MEVKDLNPKIVFEIFDEITKIPRPSKKEGKIRQYLLDFAKKHNIEAKTDEIGNVVMYKPATPGHENAPILIMQGHMDMVCESNDKNFDFDNNPITTIVDGEWVKADGTTLGADNGIGVAASLATLVDDTLVHGPLEVLVTVDEETGLTGAINLGKDMIHGKILLNLDSEDDAEVFIGCAGGVDTTAVFKYETVDAPADYQYFKIEVKDGLGGHSGCDIHLGRANANKLVTRFVWQLMNKYDVAIAEFDGGNLRNAIPRAAYAIVGVPSSKKEEVRIALNHYVADIANEYDGVEPTLSIDMESVATPATCIDSATAKNLIYALYSAPHGVISMSRDLENLVETSTNLAAVKMKPGNEILVTTSQRSSVESRKWDIANQVECVFALAGAKVTHGDGYPGWQPDMKSPIMKIAHDAYFDLFGVKPAIKAIHAGLECGLFKSVYPDLDMVSFGPTLRGVHSPSEMMHIPAVERFWLQLCRIIEVVANKG